MQSAYNSGALSEVARATQKKENKETAPQDRTTTLEDSAFFSKELSNPNVKPTLQRPKDSTGNFRTTLWASLFGRESDEAEEKQAPQSQAREAETAGPRAEEKEVRMSERPAPQSQPASTGATVARDFSSTVQDFQKAQFENAGIIPPRESLAADMRAQTQGADGIAQPQGALNPQGALPNNNNLPAPPNGNNAADGTQQMQQQMMNQMMQMNQMMLQMMNQMMKMMEQMIGKNGGQNNNNPINNNNNNNNVPTPPNNNVPTPPNNNNNPYGQNVNFINFNAQKNPGNTGGGNFLNDIESHLPSRYGTQYRDRDYVTWSHETTHGINAHISNQNYDGGRRKTGLYVGDNKAVVLENPNMRKSDVRGEVPQSLRGSRYNLYLNGQQSFENEPHYLLDEWTAYTNGLQTGVDLGKSGQGRGGNIVGLGSMGSLEFTTYAFAEAKAVAQKDPGYWNSEKGKQFKEFLAWHGVRAMDLVREGSTMEHSKEQGQDQYLQELRSGAGGQSLRDFIAREFGQDYLRRLLNGN
jgi:hypothetical protein